MSPARANLLRNDFELSCMTSSQVATRIQRDNPEHPVHIDQKLSEMAESTALVEQVVDIADIVPQIRQPLGLV
jgi:hypothetical protein